MRSLARTRSGSEGSSRPRVMSRHVPKRWPSPLSSRPCQSTTLLGANSRHDLAGTAAQSLHLKVSAVSPLRTQRVSSGASRSLLVKKLTGKVVKASTLIVARTTVAASPLAAPTPYSRSGLLSSLSSRPLICSRTSDATAGMRTVELQQRDSRRRRSLQTCSSGRQAMASGCMAAPDTMTISCTAAAALATAAAAASGASFCTRISEKACAFSWMRASCAGFESSSPER